jgi:hypothetical protein
VATGGGVADSVAFGSQISDYSIGRRPADGAWDLCRPTFGAANKPTTLGDSSVLRLNEWLAAHGALSATDFVEIFNPGSLPVHLGGHCLTDNPVGWPDRHPVRQLSYIGAGGYVLFKADGDPGQGPDHLSFQLASSQGEVGLLRGDFSPVDWVVYGPQSTDVSQGRSPNGGDAIALFSQLTPGGPNPGAGTGASTTTVNLLPVNASWKYRASSTSYHGTYQETGFDDSGWSSGRQLLHYESDGINSVSGFVKTTQMARNGSAPYATYYFRTHFQYDGPLTGVTLRATTMIDDCALIYLNGQEAARIRLPAGSISYSTYGTGAIGSGTDAAEEFITLPAHLLVQGDNVLAVEVHQANSGSSDVVWGMKLDADITSTLPAAQVAINEVLVRNSGLPNPDGSLAAWVELYNPSETEANISDMSLSISTAEPRMWVAPAGTVVPAGGFLVVQCDPSLPASATNTGFGLDPIGAGLHLFHPLAVGGGLRDSVTWGNQLADLSVGRSPNGTGAFILNLPSRGAINTPAATGPLTDVRINEWLANPANPSTESDWFELYNVGAAPVLLGGNYLTDVLDNKTKHPLAPLTFLGAGPGERWLPFLADGNASAPGHVNFSLSASGEALGLFTAGGLQLDAVAFGAQAPGVSEGSFPDGGDTIVAMPPTFGAANVQPNPDRDGDGMPDAWETVHGLDQNSPADALLDADHDGMSNQQEYLAGTDPRDAGSRLTTAVDVGGGVMLVRFTAQAGRGYTVQVSESLQDGSWQRLSDVAPQAVAGEVSVSDPEAVGKPARYYRIVTPALP